MGYSVENLLEEFTSSDFQGPIPYSLQHDYQDSACHLLTICATHGDEIGSLPPALKLFKAFTEGKTSFKGKWTLIWGNPEASKLRQRFVEQDLNRVYGQLDGNSLECQRARQISPIIKDAAFFVDFHQTIMPTLIPFYCSNVYKVSYDLARALGGANVLFSTKPPSKNNPRREIKTHNNFATFYNIPSVTIEIGVKGFNKSSELLADHILKRLLKIAALYSSDETTSDLLSKESLKHPPLSIFECCHKEPFTHPETMLLAGWKNFAPINKGDIVGYKDSQQKDPLIAPCKGVIIFPKYPQRNEKGEANSPLPDYIYLLADTIPSH